MKAIRVLVVDDSALVRMSFSELLSEEGMVVETAKNGEDALKKLSVFNPDVIILDVKMPVMDGLTALKRIMEEKPTPVIMFSSLTKEGAKETIEAIKLGAVDFVPKPDGVIVDISEVRRELINKIRAVARAPLNVVRLQKLKKLGRKVIRGNWGNSSSEPCVLIGSSTGGPSALEMIIPHLPRDLPAPVFVVQHMPPNFTKHLAERLDSISELTVKEAENNERVREGVVYVAPGDHHMGLKKALSVIRIKILDGEPVNAVKPSVDVTANYVAEIYGKNTVGVILTGMGEDGARGMKKIKDLGGYTIASSEDTCVVFGMPKAAIEIGAIGAIAPVYNIAKEIVKALEVITNG